MSLNLQLFLLLLITTLRYGFLGFTLSMFLDILIIIFLYSSLHNRRFMSQARRTRHFERSAKRARSARRGEEKNKAPVANPFFWLLIRPPTPMLKDHRKHDLLLLITFQAIRNTDSSIKPQDSVRQK